MLNRTSLLIKYLREDETFMRNNSKDLGRIAAHMYSYIALHLVLSGRKGRAFKYLLDTLKESRTEFFTRRSLAIFKRMLM
jgi:hypothetical protein